MTWFTNLLATAASIYTKWTHSEKKDADADEQSVINDIKASEAKRADTTKLK
jgi:hypothetical protein